MGLLFLCYFVFSFKTIVRRLGFSEVRFVPRSNNIEQAYLYISYFAFATGSNRNALLDLAFRIAFYDHALDTLLVF